MSPFLTDNGKDALEKTLISCCFFPSTSPGHEGVAPYRRLLSDLKSRSSLLII